MAKNTNYLLNLDVDKLFEEHRLEEIIEIDKLLDVEIERKRVDLRSMVGVRYKDILTASDAIKSMKSISENLVCSIQSITDCCGQLTTEKPVTRKPSQVLKEETIEERSQVIQIYLAICLNDQIWLSLNENECLKAAQLYLLAQHIHTGLNLMNKETLEKIPLIKMIKTNLLTLKEEIISNATHKLQSVEITAEDTSNNLITLMLLSRQNSEQLLSAFINHRMTALSTVVNYEHSSVRLQISAMVKCLLTTVILLHDCFMSSVEKGLIWQYLEEITSADAPPTLSKMQFPVTGLITYIPDIIKQFRPENNKTEDVLSSKLIITDWLTSTKNIIRDGLRNSLELVTSVKGLYLIREEALKIEAPSNWDTICAVIGLPEDFSIWYNFFQNEIKLRVKTLITKNVESNLDSIKSDFTSIVSASFQEEIFEKDLRSYVWTEETSDISYSETKRSGLFMKSRGYSPTVMLLCDKIDKKHTELLVDVSQFLFGREFSNKGKIIEDYKYKRKYQDTSELQNHLTSECANVIPQLILFASDYVKKETNKEKFVVKSLICARFQQAITELAPNFHNCLTFNKSNESWNSVCEALNKSTLELWKNWSSSCVKYIEEIVMHELKSVSLSDTLKVFPKWDTIEIEEQTEDRIFSSHIKIPLKPSISLMKILTELNSEVCKVLPHMLPHEIHLGCIENCVKPILKQYELLANENINQNQALQYLFDVKFVITLSIQKENDDLVSKSQSICDILRSKIDPFDLNVFYSHLQSNIKRAIGQSQVILGCLLPSSTHLVNLGIEKTKEQEKDPTVIPLSTPSMNSWFSLLPITAPSQKAPVSASVVKEKPASQQKAAPSPKKQDTKNVMRSGAAALFGGLTTDWFS